MAVHSVNKLPPGQALMMKPMILGKDFFKVINYSDGLSLENSAFGSSLNAQ